MNEWGTADFSGGGVIRSHGIFEQIISLENIFVAWEEFAIGKKNKKDVAEFALHLEDNLFELHKQLKSKIYQHSNYTPFYITDPKLRHIHKACVRDRVLHHAIFRVLYPLFDSHFIYDSYSCRNDKGTHRAVKRLGRFLGKASHNYTKNVYTLKCDISKFFDSIDQNILLNLIIRELGDKDVQWLIEKILHSFEKDIGKGIPLGNVTSQLFANIYLNELDQFMKHKLKVKYYIRYCDDFIIIHENKNYLLNLIPFIELFVEHRLQLKLHPRKIIVRKLSEGIDFLGYVTHARFRTLRTKTKKRMLAKVASKFSDFKQEKISQEKFDHTLQSYLGILKHCKGKKIQKVFKIYIKTETLSD